MQIRFAEKITVIFAMAFEIFRATFCDFVKITF